VLTSQGGTLVASCTGGLAYVVSWSPQQGFGSTGVARGPATSAQVTFAGGQLTVTMVVSCDAGVPTATSTTVSTWDSGTRTSAGDGD
jgi:serine/threonine-protein kinase